MLKGDALKLVEEDDPYGMNEFYEEDEPHSQLSKSTLHQSPTTNKSDKTPHTSTKKLDTELDYYQDEDFEEIDREINATSSSVLPNIHSQASNSKDIIKENPSLTSSEIDKMADKLQFIKKKIHFRLQSNPESADREEEHEEAQQPLNSQKHSNFMDSPTKNDLSKKFAKPIPSKVLKVSDASIKRDLGSVSGDDPSQAGSRKKLIIIKQTKPASSTTNRSEAAEKFSPRPLPSKPTLTTLETEVVKDRQSKPSLLPKTITPQKDKPSSRDFRLKDETRGTSKPSVPRQPHNGDSLNDEPPDSDRSQHSHHRRSSDHVTSRLDGKLQPQSVPSHRSEHKLPPIALTSQQQTATKEHRSHGDADSHHNLHHHHAPRQQPLQPSLRDVDETHHNVRPPRQQLSKPRHPTKKYQHKNRWLSDPSHRYDEATGLFSTFETEAKWQSRRELYEAVHKMKEMEKERELSFARSSASQVREERRPLFKVPKRMTTETSPISENAPSSSSPHASYSQYRMSQSPRLINDEKSRLEMEDLKRKMEYLSHVAANSKEKVVRNSYQIFGPPPDFKGFQPSIPAKPKDLISSIYRSPEAEAQIGDETEENGDRGDGPSQPSAETLQSHQTYVGHSQALHIPPSSKSTHVASMKKPSGKKRPPKQQSRDRQDERSTNRPPLPSHQKVNVASDPSKRKGRMLLDDNSPAALKPPEQVGVQEGKAGSNKQGEDRENALEELVRDDKDDTEGEYYEEDYETSGRDQTGSAKRGGASRDSRPLKPPHGSFDDNDGAVNPLIGQIVAFYGDSPVASSKKRDVVLDQEMVWTLDDAFEMLEKQNNADEENGDKTEEEAVEEWFDDLKDDPMTAEVRIDSSDRRKGGGDESEEVPYESDYDEEMLQQPPPAKQKSIHFDSGGKQDPSKSHRLRSPPPPVRKTSEESQPEEDEEDPGYDLFDDFERIESQSSLPLPATKLGKDGPSASSHPTQTTLPSNSTSERQKTPQNRRSSAELSDPGYGEEDFEDDFED